MVLIPHIYHVARSLFREAQKERRSSRWAHVRDEYLKKNPTCAACGSRTLCQVHHCEPVHIKPELELEPSNFITLCMSKRAEHHLTLGHGDNWRAWNPKVREHAAALKADPKTSKAILADAASIKRFAAA